MQTEIIIPIVLVGLVAGAFLLKKAGSGKGTRVAPLLTPSEAHFLKSLDEALGKSPTLRVFAKVRVADLLICGRQADTTRNFGRHIDFVLCENNRPVCCIELNDKSHEQKHRVRRDCELAVLFKQAKLPLLFITASNKYEAKEIAKKITAVTAPASAV